MSNTVIRVPMGKSNAYLVPGERGYLLVDAGVPGSIGVLEKTLRRRGGHEDAGLEYILADIKAVVVTHGHYDHVGALAEIKERSGAFVCVHQAEADWLRRGDCELPKTTSKVAEVLSSFASTAFNLKSTFSPVEPDLEITGEMSLDELFRGFRGTEEAENGRNPGISGHILPVPGHTSGSLAVVVGEHCCVGDSLFHLLPRKVYPPFADDPESLLSSWRVLLDTGCLYFHPGHGATIRRELLEKELRHRAGG